MPNLPMAQADLLLLLPLAWQNYLDQLPKFGAYKRGYTADLATEALKQLGAAKALPNDQARGATAEATRDELLAQRDEFLDVWQQLDGYLEEAYPAPAAYQAMRDAAGHNYYDKAGANNWSALTNLVDAAENFVAAHAAELRDQGDMPDPFAATLATEAADTRALLRRYQRETLAAEQATPARTGALQACYDTYAKMARDAQRIFRRQPELAQLFQTEYLLGIVRGTAQAGVRGTLTHPDGAPAAGVTVEAVGQGVSAITDEDGRYALALPAGSHTLAMSGAGHARQEVPVEVEAGVKRRVDGVMKQG